MSQRKKIVEKNRGLLGYKISFLQKNRCEIVYQKYNYYICIPDWG